jgi:predicted SAM-dependent methyltransferase
MPFLEIGSGGNPQPGYIHLERFIHPNDRYLVDICGDAFCLPFGIGVFDRVLMFGVFEHFGIFEIQEVMLEIIRVLKPGGVFRFDVPDFDWFMERYFNPGKLPPGRGDSWVMHAIFGGQDGPGQTHKWGWNEKRIRDFLKMPNWDFEKVDLIGRQWRDAEPNHLIWDCFKK